VSAEPGYILPPPTPPEGLLAVAALEQGDWRRAHDLALRLGRPGIAVHRLALSMRARAPGLVTESWQALASAARSPAEPRLGLRTTGPGDPTVLPWPSEEGSEFWYRFGLVGQREETQARRQWNRIEDSTYPKRSCLVEACVDYLTWVFFDHSTWRSARDGDWRLASDRVTRGRLEPAGREYFLRRANELYHSVCPLRGSLTRRVWDDLDGYGGLIEAARTALAGQDNTPTPPAVQRIAYRSAVAWARQAG
jgi:hypothetical protein